MANPADEVSEGQEVMVKCIGIDEKSGKIKLSRKALMPPVEGGEEAPAEGGEASGEERPRSPRPPRGPRRDRS